MASLSTNAAGNRRIMFKAPDGQRKTLYLGKAPVKQAQAILAHVERLVACGIDGSAPPEATAHWLAACSSELRSKLAALGLAPDAIREDVVTLGGLVERYQARPGWKNLKPASQRSGSRAMATMLEHFDADRPVRELTVADAADFYSALRLPKSEDGWGHAVATANLISSIVITLFNYAVDAELVDRNPFRKLPRTTRRGNNTMVSVAVSKTVLDALVDSEDRLVFGLARWAGTRTPSEHRGLRWSDVDWAGKRILIRSPKTERHEAGATRWVPIFPELMPLLEARFDDATEGDEFALPSYAKADKAKCTNMLRAALKRAGVDRWKRLWHSLRATRQSELAELFPAHVVSRWIGNSVAIGEKHYMMVTPEHFERATQITTQTPPANSSHGATGKRGELKETPDCRELSNDDAA